MSWKEFLGGLGFKEGVVVGAALATLLLIGCWWWGFRENVQVLDVMTALGTIGAVIAAVSLGLRDSHRRHNQGIIQARVYAASLVTKLYYAANAIHVAQKILAVLAGAPAEKFGDGAAKALHHLSSVDMPNSQSFVLVSPASTDVAIKLSCLCGDLTSFITILKHYQRDSTETPEPSGWLSDHSGRIHNWCVDLSRLEKGFLETSKTCNGIASGRY